MSVADDITLPENCAIVVGIPTSARSFSQAKLQTDRTFGAQFLGGWEQYQSQWIRHFVPFKETVQAWGVAVSEEVDLLHFGATFQRPGIHVVILFSHWSDDEVEFSDGFAKVEAIIAQIPRSFCGIVDLCVCHPRLLANELVVHRPNCLVRYSPRKSKPTYWLFYFMAVFAVLRNGRSNYPEAMRDVTSGLLEWASNVKE